MSYGRTTYRSRRRMRVRTPITLLVLLALLVTAGLYAIRQLRAPTPVSAVTATTCTPVPVVSPRAGQRVKAAAITVNVYNAGSISGLAEQTAAALKARGFVIGTVGNDPEGSKYPGYLLVRGAARDLPSVRLVLQQEKGSVFMQVKRSDDSVDAVLGARFRTLQKDGARSIPLVRTQVTFPAGCSG